MVKASVVAVNRFDKFLLLQRNKDAPWMPRKWNLPGGIINENESPKKKKKRETLEESNLKLNNIKFIALYHFEHADIYLYTSTAFENKVKIDFESMNFGWFTIDEAEKLDSVPYLSEFLKIAINYRQLI